MISQKIWNDRKFDLFNLHSFETLCFAKMKHIKKFDEHEIKKYLLDYEISNQYRIWKFINRQIIKIVHVIFDEYIKLEIEKKIENYSIFDFRLLIDQTDQNFLNNQCTIANIADSNDLNSNFAKSNVEKFNFDSFDDHQNSIESISSTESITFIESIEFRKFIRTQIQQKHNYVH